MASEVITLNPGSHTFTVRYSIKGPPVIRFGDSDRPRPITIPVIKDDMEQANTQLSS